MSRKAFTLIELLVVISIIALLSSVVLASLNSARDKARLSAGKQFAAIVDHTEADYLVGAWDFTECSGTSAADRSGNGNNGNLTNGPTWSTDTPTGTGCSVSFNGSTQYIAAGNGSSLNFGTGDFTMSVWVKTTDNSSYKGIISKGATVAADPGFKITTHQGLSIAEVYVCNGTTCTIGNLQTTTTITDGAWHQIVFTGARTSVGTLYVDGKFNSSQAFSDAASPTSISGSSPFGIGSETNSRYIIGLVDSVRLYGKAFTAAEVGKLYAAEYSRKFAKR